MASGSCSPPSVSSTYPRERPVVSGLGHSASPGLARSSSVGTALTVPEVAVPEPGWRRPGPSRKAMWRCRRALRRQQGAGGQTRADSPTSSERRQIPPDLYGLCFRCFQDGHRRQDCTNDPLCIRCGYVGHVSSQCTLPHNPMSKEELRRAVIAKVARREPAPRLSPALGERLLEPRQSTSPACISPVAPSFPPEVSGATFLEALSEVCILQRSVGMDDLEHRLKLAVVAYVGGSRPATSYAMAAEAISAQLGIPRHKFSVHKFHPQDFLVVFAVHEFRSRALVVSFVEHQGVKIFIRPWLRQAQATSRLMHVQVYLIIEGIPSHAWSRDTAAELLGSSCLIDYLAPETESMEDLSLFKLRAWYVDPDEVPMFQRLWVPEPPELVVDPAACRVRHRQLLEYPAIIHVGRLRDFNSSDNWRRAGSDGDSGQSGLPDSSDGSFSGGEWTVQPWSRGVCDDRGAGRRRQGPATGGGAGHGSYRQALEGRLGPRTRGFRP
ncbi:uncharacterized protein [Aegilops tauschii subsp. strangulata]|uniref:uncharacterized protein n=1 Tax=Aegilops tauschii subsp. strangulata TaxID=200361 RepID=UPI001ABCBC93|nr:uncharacterized protein LOC109771662 [Aegilops tauschii subsp. strangulata]